MVASSALFGRAPAPARKAKRSANALPPRSPSGSDTNAGTLDAPFAIIKTAVELVVAGDTIYLHEGTHTPTHNIQITKSGTTNAPYTIAAYNGEKVVVDGEELPHTPGELGDTIPRSDRGIFHIEADYWVFDGLEIIRGPYAIYADNSNHNTYLNLITRDNYETGTPFFADVSASRRRSSRRPSKQGETSSNLVENLDSYSNHDPRKNGGSADGLAVKQGFGEGNVIRGSRLWDNVDDGVDFIEFRSPVTVKTTYAWGNGFNRWGFELFEGDGNGFKLGGGDKDIMEPAAHVITNCIAFSNAAAGSNTRTGMQLDEPGYTVTLTSNIAVSNGIDTSLTDEANASSNSWDSGSWSDASFASLDSSILTGARAANGSIAALSSLLPANDAEIGAYYV
ncbi:polysaccharide lyase family 9 protein [Schizophyllum commune]